ncbi:MAG: hypothetical protein HRT58_20500 [Crocinitomicaceae bacterium]|nr:hypothetical protein [Flavobacteriales bacterium]NQZ38052.1 hypothetical protein [Crocinitomicaceae bacterium]
MTENGMVKALMEEYFRSAIDLKEILSTVSDVEFQKVRDEKTEDPECKSIQTIVSHVVGSGYTYINYINTISKIEWREYNNVIEDSSMGISEIDKMLNYTQSSLKHILHFENKEIETWKFESRWDVIYDFEQLMEHAIVHVLRHRRQIENFLQA